MTTTTVPDLRALAAFVVVGDVDSYPPGTCVAWLEKADRVCGLPGAVLCPRHVKVAQRRREDAIAREAKRREKRQAYLREHEPVWRERLAKVEARLDRIDPIRTEPFGGDTAMVNLPLSKRLPSGSRIHELATLHDEAADLRQRLGMSR